MRLNPVLWTHDGKMRKTVRKKLLDIANFFLEYSDFPKKYVKDIILVGSNANYNWTPASDIDLHIVIDVPEDKKEHLDCLRKLMDARRKLFNREFDIKIKNHDVEIYPQFSDEALYSGGIYSIKKDKWLKKPEKKEFVFDETSEEFKRKFDKLIHEVGKIFERCDYKKIKKFLKKLKKMRKKSLEKGGELSLENLVFKKLRSEGMIDKLMKCMRDEVSRKLSMESKNAGN